VVIGRPSTTDRSTSELLPGESLRLLHGMSAPLAAGGAGRRTVNMLEAKTHLSRLVEAIETGAAIEVVIARNGRPVARPLHHRDPFARPRVA